MFMYEYACVNLDHAKTESMRSQTPSQLSQWWVRLNVPWINLEEDSMSAELLRNASIFAKNSSFLIDSVDAEAYSTMPQLTWSLTQCWLSWQEMRLRVTQLTGNETPCQRNHRLMKKICRCQRIEEKIENTQKPYSLALTCLICRKTRTKNSMQAYLNPIFQCQN